MRQLFRAMGIVWFCLCPAVVLAQTACDASIQTALWELTTMCADIGRNQWCSPQQRAELSQLQTAQTSIAHQPAGILKMQANLPDSLPEENVTLLLLGDVTIQKLPGIIAPTLSITTNHAVNIRRSPSSVDWIITEMPAGRQLTAIGRNAAGDWLQVRLPDGDGAGPQQDSTGWVYAPNVTAEGYIESLPMPPLPLSDRPMQLFQFESRSEQCASGILLQTPPHAGWIDLQVNHVRLRLNATVFLQAAKPGEMILRVLEGVVKVTAMGIPVDVPAGAELRIPLNDLGMPTGAPALLEAYPPAAIDFLPVEFLPHLINTPPILDTAALNQLRQANSPRAGVWLIKYETPHVNCFNGQFILQYNTAEITLPDTQDILLFYETPLARTGTGTYTGTRTYQILSNDLPIGISTEVYTLWVHSPTYIEAELTGIWSFTDAGNCPVKNRFQMRFVR